MAREPMSSARRKQLIVGLVVGAIVVGGLASFDAGAGNDLQLTNIANDFNQLEILDALNVSVVDLDDITLANITIGGDFTIVDADSSPGRNR